MDRPTMYQFGTATSTGTAEDGTEVTDVSRRTRSRLALVLVAAAAGSVGATAMLRNSPVATSGAALAASSEAATSPESSGALEFTNEYGGQPMSVQSGYYPWDRIVEPYRVSTASTDCVCTVLTRSVSTPRSRSVPPPHPRPRAMAGDHHGVPGVGGGCG